jgi:hypothetical protein
MTPAAVFGQPVCTPLGADMPVGSALASASFFANLRNASNSINYLMDQLIAKSEVQAQKVSLDQKTCVRACSSPVVAVVFNSTPNMTLNDYDEASSCQKYYEATKATPIVYANREFDSQEDAEGWYEDLTQGDGEDGEDLYERCPGSCSPAYSSVIYKRKEKFLVSTSIVCGHARDKDDNQYRLNAALRWMCG